MAVIKQKNDRKQDLFLWILSFQGWKTGLEPATFGTTIRRSNRLSYNHHFGAAKIIQD